MNDIDRWFERTARQQDRAVSLYAGLLTGKIYTYFRYRLSITLVAATARFVIRVAEFLIVFSSFGGAAASTLILLRIGSVGINGAWWGLLEVMRERLRTLSHSGERGAIEREIGQWLVFSIIVALTSLIIACAALAYLLPSHHDTAGHLYAYLVMIELALHLPVEVLHSGMFATRRIYRPLWSIFAPIITQLIVIGIGFFYYPAAAIIGAIIASNAIGIWITLHYTVRAYRLAGLRPNHRMPLFSVRHLFPSISCRQGIETTLAGLTLRVDLMVILGIYGINRTEDRAFDLTTGFPAWSDIDVFHFGYLILPLLRGTYQTVGVFYFDFIRMRRIPALRQFQPWFFHKILWTTPIIGLFFWSLAVALAMLVMPDIPFSFLLALLPLFVIRSVVGTYQIRMFAEGRFRTLIAMIFLLAVLLGLVWIDANPASDLVEIPSIMVMLLIVLINIQHLRDRRAPLPTLLSLRDWIRTIGQESKPVRVGMITIPEWIPARQKSAAIRLMQQTFQGRGYFAFRSPTTLLFYQHTAKIDLQEQSHLRLQAMTGGAANRAEYLRTPLQNGRAALDVISAEKWIRSIHEVSPVCGNLKALSSEFLKIFPDGVVFDLQTGAGALDLERLGQKILTGILPVTMRSLENGAIAAPVSGRWLSSIFDQGKLRLIFILPPAFDAKLFRSWLRIVKGWHVGSATLESGLHALED